MTAVKVALSSGGQNQKLESVMSKPLKEQAFATPEKVSELIQKVPHLSIWLAYLLNLRKYYSDFERFLGENSYYLLAPVWPILIL